MKRFTALLCGILAVLLLGACAAEPAPTTTAESTYPPADKLIALTFDDGPNSSMDTIVRVLADYNAKATFFVIGKQISDQTANVIRYAHEQGHEIGNHGFAHVDMTQLTEAEILSDISQTQNAVEEITGTAPVWYRPPFLAANAVTYLLIDMPHAGHGLSAQDGTNKNSAEERHQLIVSGAYDGAIALLHCNSITASVLPQILSDLRQQGYEFVTVSELFARVGKDPTEKKNILYQDNQ